MSTPAEKCPSCCQGKLMPLGGQFRAARRQLAPLVSYCTGSGSSAMVAVSHGNLLLAVAIFAFAQIFTVILLRHRLKLSNSYWKLYEDIARACLQGEDRLELLQDVAITHPAEIGDRIGRGTIAIEETPANRSDDRRQAVNRQPNTARPAGPERASRARRRSSGSRS